MSIEPQRWLLEQLVGDRMEVRTLMANGGDPETYEPTVTQLADIRSGSAYFQVGNLPFETVILEKIRVNTPNLLVFNVSDSVDYILTDAHEGHSHPGHHGSVDPHIWSSVKNAKIMATNMLKALKQIDPEHSEEYSANYLRLSMQLDSLDSRLRSLLPAGATFMVWHPSLSYFARDYGLTQISLGVEGREPSVADLQRLISRARESGVKVFLNQRDFDRNQAAVLISGLKDKVTVTEFSPLSYDFDTQLTNIANAIAAGASD